MRSLVSLVAFCCLIDWAGLAQGQMHREKLIGVNQQLDQCRITLNPCRFPKVEGELRCGTYDVYENRQTRRGRKIALKILILPALSTQPAPDALFILAGGPGQGATENAEFYGSAFAPIRRDRDIVLIDQRGTGSSNPLDCDLRVGSRLQGYCGDLFPVAAVRRCRDQLEKRADLRLYTTPIAMADLDEVRSALGYKRINLFGTSYGTRAALVYSRRYPSHVRAVILKGVLPMSLIIPHAIARDAQRSLDLLFADCEEDGSCHQAFPNLRQEFQTVINRLAKQGATTSLPDSGVGGVEQVEISRGLFATTLRSLLQGVPTTSQVPMIIHRAFEGDFAPFTRLALNIRRSASDSLSYGMFLSVVCSEEFPVTDPKVVTRESQGTFLGDYYARQVMQACGAWPRGQRPLGYNKAVVSNAPALLISGYLDPATPPSGAAETARHLPNSLHIVIRNGSHSYAGLSPCVDNIMTAFIKRGSVAGLDTTCTKEIRRPAFVVPSTSSARSPLNILIHQEG